jgi:hypothetical protein
MLGIIQGFYMLFYVCVSGKLSGSKTPEHISKSSPHTRKKIWGLTAHQYQPGEHTHHDESDFARFFQIAPPYTTNNLILLYKILLLKENNPLYLSHEAVFL